MSSVGSSSRSGAWIFFSLSGAGRLLGSAASGSPLPAAFFLDLPAAGDFRRVSVGFLGLIVRCCLWPGVSVLDQGVDGRVEALAPPEEAGLRHEAAGDGAGADTAHERER